MKKIFLHASIGLLIQAKQVQWNDKWAGVSRADCYKAQFPLWPTGYGM
jgi:hypothetical protein